MKITLDDDRIIVFLNKRDSLFKDKIKIKDYFKDLFLYLKEIHHMILNGYYSIDVYYDKCYGYILEIENKDIYEHFEQIDMQINIIEDTFFLYEFDYSYLPDVKGKYYQKRDKLYLKIEDIDNIKLGILLEHANIIYGEKALNIIKYSKKVNI